MPARSNPFQKLILRIHEQLVPAGIRVTVQESAFSEEPSSGAPRETDVQIIMETPSGTERIAIECRDHARAQEVGWIDSLIGKYIDLEFDKIIAVSSSGFSSTALLKGAKFQIECRTLEDAEDVDWPAEFIKVGVATITHQLVDLKLGIKCEPPLPGCDELADVIIATDGSQYGYKAVMKWLEIEAGQHFLSKRKETFRVLADFDHKYGIEISRRPNDVFVVHKGTRYSVVRFTFACAVVTTRTKHTVRHQRYPSAMVSAVEGVILGEDLTVIQGTNGVAHAFKGAAMEKIEMTLYDSAKGQAEPLSSTNATNSH